MKYKTIKRNQVITFSSARKGRAENEIPWKQGSVYRAGLFHQGKERSVGEPSQGQTLPMDSLTGFKRYMSTKTLTSLANHLPIGRGQAQAGQLFLVSVKQHQLHLGAFF
jgi:hypothetical protein